jgi:hypothetical protein
MLDSILAVWPVLVVLAGLAVAWGAALTRIADLRERVANLETGRDRERERVAVKLDELGRGLSRIEGMLAGREQQRNT